MTEIDLSPLQPALEKFIPLRRSGLLPALHAAQEIYGWLPREVAAEVAKTLHVPLADVHGVIEFYSLFYNEPVGRKIVRVCADPACALKDADGLLARLRSQHGIEDGQTTPDGTLTIERSPCLGLCEHAPASWTVDGGISTVGDGTAERDHPQSMIYGSLRMLTVNCGNGTTSLAKYGEYAALKKARAMKPEEVVNEIKSSGLVGRGGAGFSAALKWEGAAKADGSPKYVICNADESEPGTFKDRVLLLDDPHRAIEGMCIAAYAVGASKGYVYLRGEYPYILPPLENALNEARAAGYLNEDFDIEIRVGAGAYICGEETALFESIEGKRGFPRVKPPFPITNGLFDKPTVINNVETLFNVPLIIEKGAAEYRKIGTEKSSGPKLFCLSGDPVWDYAARTARNGWRRDRRPAVHSLRRRGGRLCHARAVGREVDLRGPARRGTSARLGRGDGLQRDARHARRVEAPRQVLRARKLRQVLSLPDGHPAPDGNPGARGRQAHVARRRAPLAGCRLDDDGRVPVRAGTDRGQRGVVRDEVMA
ncbi:MAG: hypothetical protein DCC54_06365 [Anaerolineae bacterium]|nr:MAG: hypothetical protein DCC54_06365 [Anaerolineae bacterium]